MMANAPKDLSPQDYRKIDQAHAWHPLFQHQLLDQSDLLVFESASGTTIIDADGNEYLDAYSALWNVNVGYGTAGDRRCRLRTDPEVTVLPHTRRLTFLQRC